MKIIDAPYRVKEWLYKYAVLYDIPEEQMNIYIGILDGSEDDNGVLTYCYLDTTCGIRYKAICCCEIDEKKEILFDMSDSISTGLIICDGDLTSHKYLIEEGGDMEEFQEIADSVKEAYGYNTDYISVKEDIPFDAYRHPFYKQDIWTFFYKPDDECEAIWVREVGNRVGMIAGKLLNEPYDQKLGIHKNDIVLLSSQVDDEGNQMPIAILDWMKDPNLYETVDMRKKDYNDLMYAIGEAENYISKYGNLAKKLTEVLEDFKAENEGDGYEQKTH